ncbi:hypothetical protein TNCV_3357591 [Trichonephila clavipes]|nr:hypothetical protein TNCV_3357591 [Trichonephila clavipes]
MSPFDNPHELPNEKMTLRDLPLGDDMSLHSKDHKNKGMSSLFISSDLLVNSFMGDVKKRARVSSFE